MNCSRLLFVGIPLSILLFSHTFLTAQNQGVFKAYSNVHAYTSAVGEFNDGGNFLINTCIDSNSRATYLWTDSQGNLLDNQSDFVGSCGVYRYDADDYIKTDGGGTAPNRDIRLTRINRLGVSIWSKTYPLDLDNFGQFAIPSTEGGFLVAGSTKVPGDTAAFKIQLLKTDINGNLLWQKTVTQGLFYSPVHRPGATSCTDVVNGTFVNYSKIGQTTDGGYYLEYLTNNAAFDCTSGGGNGAVLVRLDANGNYLWHKADISGVSEQKYHKAFPVENGNMIYQTTYSSPAGSSCIKNGYKLMKIAPSGDTLWSFTRDGQNCTGSNLQYAGAVAIAANGDVYMETQKGTLIRRINGRSGVQMDSINVPYQQGLTAATNMITTSDGSFVMVGGVGEVVYFYKNKFPAIADNYCTSHGIEPWEYWVSNVHFDTINNYTDKYKTYSSLGYSDYTSTVVSPLLTKGQTYPLSITPGVSWFGILPTTYGRVWIDFNKNNIFEDSEKVLESTNVSPMVANVLVPLTALSGRVLMRVSVKGGAYPTPCEIFDKGEVEDYVITIADDQVNCTSDSIAPVITCPPNMVVFTASGGQDSALVSLSIPSVKDNCNHTALFATLPTGETVAEVQKFPFGLTPVQWTAYDLMHNISTCTMTVSVVKGSSIKGNSNGIKYLREQPTQLTPVVVQTISPNPAHDQLAVQLESLQEYELAFNIADALGKTIKTEMRKIEKGTNYLFFQVWDLAQGIYFITPLMPQGNTMPTKFVKM